MYEFEEDRWDEQETETDETRGILEGWLIQRTGDGQVLRISTDQSGSGRAAAFDQPLFLQIGTGQWCGAPYATLFPRHSTAMVYAKEFGYVVGQSVQIVRHRF